jgi:outer membrane protein assembly factor BamB
LEWKSLEGQAGYSAAVVTEIENNKLLLIYHATALSCLNPQNGTELWKIPWETDYGVNAATPALSGDTLFHSSGYEKGCQAVKISKNEFKILWTNKTIQAQHTDPMLIDGYVYCYSGESSNMSGHFKCVELKTGKEMWADNSTGMGTCIFSDGYIVCLDIKGNLHLIKPNPREFVKISVLNSAIPEVRNPAWTSPVIANGKLYLRYMQKLMCYRIADK